MQCECGRSMRKRQVTKAAPYAYTESGLDNVVLSGITVYVCPYCQAEVPVIPRIGQLHRVIADTLLHKPELLTGQELRFLERGSREGVLGRSNRGSAEPNRIPRVPRRRRGRSRVAEPQQEPIEIGKAAPPKATLVDWIEIG